MNIIEIISLFGIMIVLAALPSASVALVVARSVTLGIRNGIAVAAGIVAGDLIFVLLAILGLSVVAETMGSLFMIIKYLGACYLLWLGISLLTSQSKTTITPNTFKQKSSLIASFLAGVFLTLGDIKAIIFYVSLLPMFIDLSALQTQDILIVLFVTITSVGGVKVFYALSAIKVADYARELKFENAARKTAGGLMLGAGTYLIVKT